MEKKTMGRPRKPITEHKRQFTVTLSPKQIQCFENSLIDLQDYVLQNFDLQEHEVRNAFTRSSLVGELVNLLGSPEGLMMMKGVIGNTFISLGVQKKDNDTRSFLDEP